MSEPVIALIGLRGSGKSSVGHELAEALEVPFYDLDESLVGFHVAGDPATRSFTSAGAILSELGEEGFRDLEARVLREVLAIPGPKVLATGGGVVERSENRELLAERCTCVWLDGPLEILLARIEADSTLRPPLTDLDPAAELAALARRRAPLYAEVATLKLDTSSSGIKTIVCVILDRLRR